MPKSTRVDEGIHCSALLAKNLNARTAMARGEKSLLACDPRSEFLTREGEGERRANVANALREK